MNFERLWGNLKIVFENLEKLNKARGAKEDGFAAQALKCMTRLEQDEFKLQRKERTNG
jgi:hypothetical protein